MQKGHGVQYRLTPEEDFLTSLQTTLVERMLTIGNFPSQVWASLGKGKGKGRRDGDGEFERAKFQVIVPLIFAFLQGRKEVVKTRRRKISGASQDISFTVFPSLEFEKCLSTFFCSLCCYT